MVARSSGAPVRSRRSSPGHSTASRAVQVDLHLEHGRRLYAGIARALDKVLRDPRAGFPRPRLTSRTARRRRLPGSEVLG